MERLGFSVSSWIDDDVDDSRTVRDLERFLDGRFELWNGVDEETSPAEKTHHVVVTGDA